MIQLTANTNNNNIFFILVVCLLFCCKVTSFLSIIKILLDFYAKEDVPILKCPSILFLLRLQVGKKFDFHNTELALGVAAVLSLEEV